MILERLAAALDLLTLVPISRYAATINIGFADPRARPESLWVVSHIAKREKILGAALVFARILLAPILLLLHPKAKLLTICAPTMLWIQVTRRCANGRCVGILTQAVCIFLQATKGDGATRVLTTLYLVGMPFLVASIMSTVTRTLGNENLVLCMALYLVHFIPNEQSLNVSLVSVGMVEILLQLSFVHPARTVLLHAQNDVVDAWILLQVLCARCAP